MRIIYHSPTAVHIALSRLNVEALLRMLDQGQSREGATLTKAAINDDGAAMSLLVSAEEDAVHYKAQGRPVPEEGR